MKAYKFKLKVPKSVQTKLEQTLDICRELYNSGLRERIDAYQINHISLNYQDQQNQLPDIRKSREDVGQIYSQVLQDALKRLDKTFKAFFSRVKKGDKKVGFPRFKGKNRYDSFTFPQANGSYRVDGNNLHLSKIGKVKLHLSQNILGKVKTCTIKKEIDAWFVIFTVETTKQLLPKTGKQIGIDMGISSFATLSDGTQIDNFKYFESTQAKLRVKQRSVARKKKGSNCRRKAVKQLRKVHEKIKNQRNDFQHKVSTHLVKAYDLVAIEKLSILGMSRGILSKQILDASWSSFFQKLKYKAENAGKSVIEVNPNYTSQDCSKCGNRVKKDLSVRVHHCLKCGLKLDRDVNASINILGLGLSLETLTYQNTDCVVSESQFITTSV